MYSYNIMPQIKEIIMPGVGAFNPSPHLGCRVRQISNFETTSSLQNQYKDGQDYNEKP